MKLKHLHVDNYKNLVNFDIDFSSGNGLTMLVGNNGSGKSNVLEVLSAIFANVYSKDYKHKIECTLEYEINGCTVKIKQSKKTRMYFVEGERKGLKHLINEKLLPSNIVVLYSGEDQRLYRTFYERFDLPSLKENMQYIDSKYWDVALLTLLGGLPNEKEFLSNKIGIKSIDYIFLTFFKDWDKNIGNQNIKAFVDEIIKNSIDVEIKKPGLFSLPTNMKDIFDKYKICYEDNLQFASPGKTINAIFLKDRINEEGKFLNFNDSQKVFNNLARLYIDIGIKCIKDIEIIGNNYRLKTLSEGEKKLILLKAIFSFATYENSLIFLDEPDANIHEERKDDLYKMFLEYASAERQIVVTTHSPILLNLTKDGEYTFLKTENNTVRILPKEEIDGLKLLCGNTYDALSKSITLSSKKPLVIFEGKTDVEYVKQAIEILKVVEPKYKEINADFLSAGGAGNTEYCLRGVMPFLQNKKEIFIFFDNDNGGADGVRKLCKYLDNEPNVMKTKALSDGLFTYEIENKNLTMFYIPYKNGRTNGSFMIEDYFSENKVGDLIKEFLKESYPPFGDLPSKKSFREAIKNKIENNYQLFNVSDLEGFKALLDKIYDLTVRKNSIVSEVN